MKHPKPPITIPQSQIKKIHYSGLKGRIAHFPAASKSAEKTFVLISGHHTSHERMASFAVYLSDFGEVYCIDVPGFGGMNSFPKIGKKIDFDSYAEYLYTVLKTQKLTKDVTIFAVSIGGQFVTRMLQKYPESQGWVESVVGLVTFGAGKDFKIGRVYKAAILPLVYVGANPVGVKILNLLIFNRVSLKVGMVVLSRFKRKMKSGDNEYRKKSIQMEYFLWLINDHRTQAITTKMMFYDDLRRYSEDLIKVPMHNVITKKDQYVDYKEVNKSMRDLYEDYTPHYLTTKVHMPSIMASKEDVLKMFDQSMADAIMGVKK